MICSPIGPLNAQIMLVGEAPGRNEEEKGMPFVGASGDLLKEMLFKNGINYDQCYVTNVCKFRPPQNEIANFFYTKTEAKKRKLEGYAGHFPDDKVLIGIAELYADINRVKPNLIIAIGNTALWALTGLTGTGTSPSGITKWRGSTLPATIAPTREDGKPYKVVPIIHPAGIMRKYSDRFWTEHDLKVRCDYSTPDIPEPNYRFIVRPSFTQTVGVIKELMAQAQAGPLRLAVDIETRRPHLACIGLAWSKRDAICIPIMSLEHPIGYWNEEEEVAIVNDLRHLLTHPNVEVSGQNFDYDRQYIARYWGIKANLKYDTMTMWHTLFPGTPKGLDFISSMTCDYHVYWKDESKDLEIHDEDRGWVYNCKDCVVTFEATEVLCGMLTKHNMWEQYNFQLSLHDAVLKSVLRGINFDDKHRNEMALPLLEMMNTRAARLERLVGFNVESKSKKPWYNSPQQAMTLFYEWGKVKPIINRKTKRPTTDADALPLIGKREPIFKPICDILLELRSIQQFYQNYIKVPLDSDKRIRCQLKITGTETFRFASSEDAFGFGTNLQNISKGNKLEEEE